jgi:hypothetical protein
MEAQRGMECWASILILTYVTTRTAELSAVLGDRDLPLRKFLCTHFCWRLIGPQGYRMPTEGLGHLKNSKDPIGY